MRPPSRSRRLTRSKIEYLGARRLVAREQAGERWPLLERAVRLVLVEVPDVAPENVLEVAAAKDQQPIETFAPRGSDPPLGARPRIRSLYRRFDHPDAFGAKDLVEVT